MADFELVTFPYDPREPGPPIKSAEPLYNEFLGSGVYLPFQVQNGGLRAAAGFNHLHQSIFTIILTPKGSRRMRPWFGSNLYKYIDAPVNRQNIAKMRAEIFEALREETRGEVKQIIIDTEEPHHINISVVMLINRQIAVAFNLSYDRDLKRWEGIQI